MAKVNVLIYVESRYKVNRKRIKKSVQAVLGENNIDNPTEVSIAVVGDRKMKSLNSKYRQKDQTTNVLSFPLTEGAEIVQGEGPLRLGDIVISYPQVIREASRDDVLVDDKIEELVNHSMYHLLGIHHS